jgi:hypothetical protein
MYNINRVIAIVVLASVAPGALYAGYSFITDPSGAGMSMNTSYLLHSPFKNYLIPGIVLFIVNGICNIITAIATIKKSKHNSWLIILQGSMLSGWIVVQILMMQDIRILHLLFFSLGIILIKAGINLTKRTEVSY